MTPAAVSTTSAAQNIPRTDWENLSPAGHPFLNADFFAILEAHQTAGPACGWQAQHWLSKDSEQRVIGIVPSYIKSNSHGDFIRDWSWASAYRQLGKNYYPKLLSALPHTPASGPRLLLGHGENAEAARHQLIETIKDWVATQQFSSWHVALPAADEVAVLEAHGLLVSHDVQFHWHDRDYGDFAGFLGAFPSEKRRKVKAERRRIAESGLLIEVRHGDEIDAGEWPALHQLYASTFDKYGNYAAFSAACLADLAASLGQRMVLFIAREAGRPIAISICFRSNDTLYGRYWGTISSQHSLHFELCFYQGIAYCLRHGLHTFEPGAGGEHKVARGFEPTLVRSCHWIEDPRMRQLLRQYLQRHHQAVLTYADEAASHLPWRKSRLKPPPAPATPG